MQIIRLFFIQMLEELRQAFRLYDKEQHGYISTMILKVRSWKALEVCQQQMARHCHYTSGDHQRDRARHADGGARHDH